MASDLAAVVVALIQWAEDSSETWRPEQSRRDLLLVCRYRASGLRNDAPARLVAQCRANPATHLWLVFRCRNENRPEFSAVDLIVMWPAARAAVLPMPAERDGHHGADCRWIGALGQ